MNRSEFMKKLEELLANIPKEEREEAMQYYNDYFEDAGPEHEGDVIRELGSPEKIAETLGAVSTSETSSRKETYKSSEGYVSMDVIDGSKNTSSFKNWFSGNPGKVVFIIILCVICAPIVLPILFAICMTIFGLVVAAVSVFAALVIAAGSIAIAGVVTVVMGFPMLVVSFPIGIFSIGSGLILGVLGVIGVVGAVKLCTIVYPAIYRFVTNLFRKIFRKTN